MLEKIKLRIGKIPYANLFPIFYTLEREFDCSSYEFVEGVPSKLNRMLRDGEIDISISSSVEYLMRPSLYHIIEGHSISSRGPAVSVLLISEKKIEDMDGSGISVTSQSDTSIALLNIILKRFYGVRCRMEESANPLKSGSSAFLLIGDDALKYRSQEAGKSGQKRFIYDLGDLWYKNTGLPFVFALWIMRKDIERKEDLLALSHRFIDHLNNAKGLAMQNLKEIARHAPVRNFMTEEEIILYWRAVDFGLDKDHLKGLELFNKYLVEISAQ
ncbi:MAG: menaquinone biosynthesis protein [Nitrospirae bacterium]|nr:menaquinone biosynthesis protein [Nitrospirota bacterium]